MSGDARSPWTERERDALNVLLRENEERVRVIEIELAVMKTKIGFYGTLFGIVGAALTEGVKLLLHH